MSANAPQTTTTTWNIDPVHTTAEFKVRHMMITNVKGHFKPVTGVITIDEADITRSSVEASIDAASIDTREADRDTHLRSAEFLDVEKFPKLTFTSTRVTRTGQAELEVEGDLTIHGVTRSVTFDASLLGTAKDPWGNERIAFEAETTINRKDFGLTWNAALETGGFLVGDEVAIAVSVQAVPARA
jgi:polyisoprenoid-binding protein YceI